MPINLYGYIYSGDKCTAKPNKGYEFQNWVFNLRGNHTQAIKVSNSAPTNIYEYIANFLDSIRISLILKMMAIFTNF